jgi:hypothetical protein
VALVFGLSSIYIGRELPILYIPSGVVAVGLGGLTLFARKTDFSRIAMSVLLTSLGAFAGFSLVPIRVRPEPLKDLCVIVPAAVGGWIIGCLLSRWEDRMK